MEFCAIVTVNAGDCHEQDDTTGDGQYNYCVCFSNAYKTLYSSPLEIAVGPACYVSSCVLSLTDTGGQSYFCHL